MLTKVGTGASNVGERLSVQVDRPWNNFARGQGDNIPTWTNEGFSVDALRFFSGIRDGQPLAVLVNNNDKNKPPVFKAGMQPAEVVSLFETFYTRDGSAHQLGRLEPADFGGVRGWRWEFEVTRKTDDVRLQGLGYAAVHQGQLYAITFTAPRLNFFPRYRPAVEKLIATARIQG
jgi:hypothetical protein